MSGTLPAVHRHRRWLLIVLFAGFVLTAGCGAGTLSNTAGGQGNQSNQNSSSTSADGLQTETQNQTYKQPVTRVEINVDSGAIKLTPGTAGQVAVRRDLRWNQDKPTIDERFEGTTLKITAKCPNGGGFGHLCEIDYALAVPPEISVDAETSAGAVSAQQLAGTLSLRSQAGAVAGQGLRSAEVTAQTSAGAVDLQFAAAPNKVDAESKAGAVQVTVPRGDAYRVTADTSAGDKQVDVTQDPGSSRSIDARTSAGQIQVRYG